MMTTLDGYFEGENHDISWHNVDAEFNIFANKQLDEADTLVFGRRTYELMADFWPKQEGMVAAPDTAERMNALNKIVFSRKPFTPDWKSTIVYTDVKMLGDIKRQPGKSIAVLGSSNLGVSLLEQGLLDEVRVMVNPVALGRGTALFDGLDNRARFHLASTRTFKDGNVLICYDTRTQ